MSDIDPEERESVIEDLEDLEAMRSIFEDRGFRGVVIVCSECGEDHFYGWEMLKESLEHMLQTGEPRMHEPAYEPYPDEYVGWDYARGYLDSITDQDVDEMEAPAEEEKPRPGTWLADRTRCSYCRGRLPQPPHLWAVSSWTPEGVSESQMGINAARNASPALIAPAQPV